MTRRYKVNVLDYIVTSNHVHLLVTSRKGKEISEGLRYLHGLTGQWYNSQRGQDGSFWSDRFHSTMIQDGKHLGRCLFYIDLNMVRTGVVDHPSKWEHTAYHEFMGKRQRYKIVNTERLLKCLGVKDIETFRKWYIKTLNGLLDLPERKRPPRQPYWAKALAVGDIDWLNGKVKSTGIKRYKIVSTGKEFYLTGHTGKELE